MDVACVGWGDPLNWWTEISCQLCIYLIPIPSLSSNLVFTKITDSLNLMIMNLTFLPCEKKKETISL